MLAGDADRERAVNVLKDAFTEGRLTQPEYEDRVARAYQSRTYADLDALTLDIPSGRVPPAAVVPAAPPYGMVPVRVQPTNGTAVGSLVCGLAGFVTCGLTSIPAVVLGHVARRAIRETGQDGDGLAVAGLSLGYIVLAIWMVLLVVGIAVA